MKYLIKQKTLPYHLSKYHLLIIMFILHLFSNCVSDNEKIGNRQNESTTYELNLGNVVTHDNSQTAYSDFYKYEAKFHFHGKEDFDSIFFIHNSSVNYGKFSMKLRGVMSIDYWGQLRDSTIGKNILIGVIQCKDSIGYDVFIHEIEEIMQRKKIQLTNCTLKIDSVYYPKSVDATGIFIQ
jgi:hypothetical protein